MSRFNLPHSRPGQTIGLLGGSFDPAHQGHVQISRAALQRFGLDQLWWLVSPGNPLKTRGPASMAERLAKAQQIMRHPKVRITDIEARLGTRHTAQTIARLRELRPQARFVWLMGADNLVQIHLWQDWQEIFAQVPVGVLARPGQRIPARMSKAARIYRPYRIRGRVSRLLAKAEAPAWSFVNLPMSGQSSSAIRAAGDWE